MELCLEVDDDQVKNLWVRTKGLANVHDSVVGHLTRKKKMMIFSTAESSLTITDPVCHGGTSTMLTSVAKNIQLGTNSPEGSCRALMETF